MQCEKFNNKKVFKLSFLQKEPDPLSTVEVIKSYPH